MEDGAEAVAEGGDFGAGKVDLAVDVHEKLDGFELGVARGDVFAVVDELVGKVFDGVSEFLKGVSGFRGDAAAVDWPGRGMQRRRRGAHLGN